MRALFRRPGYVLRKRYPLLVSSMTCTMENISLRKAPISTVMTAGRAGHGNAVLLW